MYNNALKFPAYFRGAGGGEAGDLFNVSGSVFLHLALAAILYHGA